MKITLIITTYNWPESLLLVIESIKRQTILPDEIIIADDGSTKETKDLINNFYSFLSQATFHIASSMLPGRTGSHFRCSLFECSIFPLPILSLYSA